jgi:hypothetical protein
MMMIKNFDEDLFILIKNFQQKTAILHPLLSLDFSGSFLIF